MFGQSYSMPSSVISTFKYFPETKILRITYVSGKIYDYINVSVQVYDALKQSDSKGNYLNKYIKGKYKYEKIN